MKKIKKIFCMVITLIFVITCSLFLSGCGDTISIKSIEKTNTTGLVDTYTITYTNGKTTTFTVTNGQNGKDGTDGESVSIEDIYYDYCEKYGEISYTNFLKEYLTLNTDKTATVINSCLSSCLKIYTEFAVTSSSGWGIYSQTTTDIAIYTGAAIIYKMNTDYTYIITNYHVVYNSSADTTLNNNSKIAKQVYGYLYGSESSPQKTSEKDINNLTIYDYGDYGIPFEYVGGSISNDLAVLKTQTSNITKVNPQACAVKLANNYYVGEKAIAIGNPEDEGISVTQGIVSIDNEFINLSIDGTTRKYRSIRIDTALYSGNSGGGLFDFNGNLIGITNAGDGTDENINYAIPLNIVKGIADNILYYYTGSQTSAYKISLGIAVNSKNSKYTYYEDMGYGTIIEDVCIENVSDDSIANTLGIQKDDIIKSISINNVEYKINRYFDIADIILQIRANDNIKISYKRAEVESTTSSYQVQSSDLTSIA